MKKIDWPKDRIWLDGFYYPYFGKCRKGWNCRARFDRLAHKTSRDMWFREKKELRKFTDKKIGE
jgi:hypothetical protein